MLKKYKGKLILSAVLILLPVFVGLILWNRLPAQMPIHFNIRGEADGWSSRAFAVFGIPAFLLAMHLLCLFVTFRDQGGKKQSEKIFNILFFIVPAISLILGGTVYPAALGMDGISTRLIFLLLSLMMLILGNIMPKTTPNRVFGVRIKWTLESDANWTATHRFCGRLWVCAGVLMAVLTMLPFSWAPYAALAVIFPATVAPILYSYVYSKKNTPS